MSTIEKARRTYFGMSGQHYAMSEFLVRGYNVAIPEVDVGDDVIVIKDDIGNLTRVQVKSVTLKQKTAKRNGKITHHGCVNLRKDQLYAKLETDLFYFVPFRFANRWQSILIIERASLHSLHVNFLAQTKDRKRGPVASEQISLNFSMDKDFKQITAWGGTSFDVFREDWAKWPAKI